MQCTVYRNLPGKRMGPRTSLVWGWSTRGTWFQSHLKKIYKVSILDSNQSINQSIYQSINPYFNTYAFNTYVLWLEFLSYEEQLITFFQLFSKIRQSITSPSGHFVFYEIMCSWNFLVELHLDENLEVLLVVGWKKKKV